MPARSERRKRLEEQLAQVERDKASATKRIARLRDEIAAECAFWKKGWVMEGVPRKGGREGLYVVDGIKWHWNHGYALLVTKLAKRGFRRTKQHFELWDELESGYVLRRDIRVPGDPELQGLENVPF